jgi:BlaI family transcriptional regulator, penicillinase repressor
MEIKATKPTESELEILQILWQKQPTTVRAVHEALSVFKESGYTTTLKLMQIMFEKGLVARDERGKTHIYTTLISKEETQAQMVNKMVTGIFGGSGSSLVLQALGNHTPTKAELAQIEAYINELKKQ